MGFCGLPRSKAMRLRRLTFMRSCRPSSRYRRYTRVLPTGQPSRLSITNTLRSPTRGRPSTMSRLRWRSALWARASLLAYQLERCNSASRHERCTLTLKRSCIQAASSRRLAALRAFF